MAFRMPERKEQAPDYTKLGLVTGFSIVGMLTFFYYAEPAANCEKSEGCAKFITLWIPEDLAYKILLWSGGSGFALSNGLLSGLAASKLINYLRKQPTRLQAFLKATGIFTLFVPLQLIPTLLASLATSKEPSNIILTNIGATPGAVYTAMDMIDETGPIALSDARHALTEFKHSMRIPCSEEEEKRFALKENQKQEIAKFEKRLEKVLRNREALANLDAIQFNDILDSLESFEVSYLSEIKESEPAPYVEWVARFTGSFLTANFTLPLILAAHEIIGRLASNETVSDYVTITPLEQWLLALACSVSNIYNNLKITVGGAENILSSLQHLLLGEDIPSSTLRTHPREAYTALAFAIVSQLFSFAAIGMMWQDYYNYSGKDEFRYGAWLGIIAYHMSAIHKLGITLIKLTHSDEKLFKLEETLQKLKRMSPAEFKAFEDSPYDLEAGRQDPENPPVAEEPQQPAQSWGEWLRSYLPERFRGHDYAALPQEETDPNNPPVQPTVSTSRWSLVRSWCCGSRKPVKQPDLPHAIVKQPDLTHAINDDPDEAAEAAAAADGRDSPSFR